MDVAGAMSRACISQQLWSSPIASICKICRHSKDCYIGKGREVTARIIQMIQSATRIRVTFADFDPLFQS
jgi:hypothetical protein